MENALNRLQKYFEKEGISTRQVELKCGFSNGSLGSQFKNNKAIGIDRVENILYNFPEINPNWIFTGNGEMKLSIKDLEISDANLVPVYDVYATAGSGGAVTDHPVEYINPGDLFRDADAVIRIYGDSMGEGYKSGSFVPTRKLADKTKIVPGMDYVIETTEIRVLKTLRNSDKPGYVTAVSINDDTYEKGELAGKLIHQPFDISWDDVISTCIALGNVRRNQITTINGKQ